MVVQEAPRVDLPPGLDSSRVLVRSRLLKRLTEASRLGLGAVVAPAGFGKTTLITQFVGQADLPVAWLSLTPEDEDAHELTARIQKSVEVATHSHSQSWVEPAGMTSWLHSAPQDAFVLVLEDLHEVATDSPGGSLIARLIREQTPSYLTILSSRAEPRMPEYVARKAARDLVFLGPSDLAFTEDDLSRFVKASGKKVNANTMLGASGGWPLAIASSVLGDMASPTSSDLETYFESQVLAALPIELQKFMALSAWMSPVTAEACDVALDLRNSEARLRALEATAFLVTSNGEGRSRYYTYHPLFRDFLRSYSQSVWPNEVRRVHFEAWRYYRERHEWLQAASHLRELRAWSPLQELASQAAPRLRLSSRWQSLLSILQ